MAESFSYIFLYIQSFQLLAVINTYNLSFLLSYVFSMYLVNWHMKNIEVSRMFRFLGEDMVMLQMRCKSYLLYIFVYM